MSSKFKIDQIPQQQQKKWLNESNLAKFLLSGQYINFFFPDGNWLDSHNSQNFYDYQQLCKIKCTN